MDKKSNPTSRKLKVQPKLFRRKWSKDVNYPEIKLCGRWLQDLGFVHGQIVVVKYEQNRLIIEAS